MNEDSRPHQMDIPDELWKIGQRLSGKSNPASFFRNLLIRDVNQIIMDRRAKRDAESAEAAPEPKPNPLVKPELHVAVDWNKYGMGFDPEDPDFTDVILPWFIELKGGEKQAEARIIEKMSQGKNPITNPRAWVADLYYKNKKRNAG